MHRGLLVLLLAVSLGLATSQLFPCGFGPVHCPPNTCIPGEKAPVVISFDLTPMRINETEHRDYVLQDVENYDWYANICGTTTRRCHNVSAPAIMFSVLQQSRCYVVGRRPEGSWQLQDPDDARKGVMLTYTGGEDLDCNLNPRSVRYLLNCDPNEPGVRFVTAYRNRSTEPFGKCDYVLVFSSRYACPTIERLPLPDDKGLSGGSIFLIILLVFTAVYLGGGVFWNWRKGKRAASELIPHYSFWTGIWDNAKEGFKVSLGCIGLGPYRHGRRAGSGGYGSITTYGSTSAQPFTAYSNMAPSSSSSLIPEYNPADYFAPGSLAAVQPPVAYPVSPSHSSGGSASARRSKTSLGQQQPPLLGEEAVVIAEDNANLDGGKQLYE